MLDQLVDREQAYLQYLIIFFSLQPRPIPSTWRDFIPDTCTMVSAHSSLL